MFRSVSLISATTLLATAIFITGCASDPKGPSGPTTPSPTQIPPPTPPPPPRSIPPPAATSATLQVLVDGTCAGKQSNISIYVDGTFRGVVQPGGSGVSLTVSLGNHTIYGRSQQGTVWGPLTESVGAGGQVSRLTCVG